MQCHHVPLWGVAGPLLGGLEAAQICQRFNIVVIMYMYLTLEKITDSQLWH